jgi:hypothetical protein
MWSCSAVYGGAGGAMAGKIRADIYRERFIDMSHESPTADGHASYRDLQDLTWRGGTRTPTATTVTGSPDVTFPRSRCAGERGDRGFRDEGCCEHEGLSTNGCRIMTMTLDSCFPEHAETIQGCQRAMISLSTYTAIYTCTALSAAFQEVKDRGSHRCWGDSRHDAAVLDQRMGP